MELYSQPLNYRTAGPSECTGGSGGGGRCAVYLPEWRSVSGLIILILMMSLVLSLFLCLVRFDFNFVLYLFGYLIWCIDARHDVVPVNDTRNCLGSSQGQSELWVASKQTFRAVEWLTRLFGGAVLLDISWLYLAVPAWLCWDDTEDNVMPSSYCGALAGISASSHGDSSFSRLMIIHRLHSLAIAGTVALLCGKILLIGLSRIWICQQKRRHQNHLAL